MVDGRTGTRPCRRITRFVASGRDCAVCGLHHQSGVLTCWDGCTDQNRSDTDLTVACQQQTGGVCELAAFSEMMQ